MPGAGFWVPRSRRFSLETHTYYTEHSIMSAKISDSLLATCRLDYLGGQSLRQIAEKRKISLKSLANVSKAQQWVEARRLQQFSTQAPALISAATDAVGAVASSWREQVEHTLHSITAICKRAALVLGKRGLDSEDLATLSGVIRVMCEAMPKLADLSNANGANGHGRPLAGLPAALGELDEATVASRIEKVWTALGLPMRESCPLCGEGSGTTIQFFYPPMPRGANHDDIDTQAMPTAGNGAAR